MPFLETFAAYSLVQAGAQYLSRLVSNTAAAEGRAQQDAHHAERLVLDRARLSIEERRIALQEAEVARLHDEQAQEPARREAMQRYAQHLDLEGREWPLRLPPEYFRNLKACVKAPIILLAPPEFSNGWPAREIAQLCHHFLQSALHPHYDRNHPERPAIYLGDAWRAGAVRDETALELLAARAPGVPIVVLQVDYFAGKLHLSVGCSGFGEHPFPLRAALGAIAIQSEVADSTRKHVREIAPVLQEIHGSRGHEAGALFSRDAQNAQLRQLEEQHGVKLDSYYRYSPENITEAAHSLGPALQIVATGMVDGFHWTRNATLPHLPLLLPAIIAQFPGAMSNDLSRTVLAHYEAGYTATRSNLPTVADAQRLLRLAGHFTSASVKQQEAAGTILNQAVTTYLAARSARAGTVLQRFIQSKANGADLVFAQEVIAQLEAAGQEAEARSLEQAIADARQRLSKRPLQEWPFSRLS